MVRNDKLVVYFPGFGFWFPFVVVVVVVCLSFGDFI